MLVTAPSRAFADNPLEGTSAAETKACIAPDGNGQDGKGLTVRIVGCTKEIIFKAVEKILPDVSKEVDDVINTACLLLVLVSGIMVLGGRSPPYRELLLNLARIAFVITVTTNVVSNFKTIVGVMDSLIEITTLFDESTMKEVISKNCEVQDNLFGSNNEVSPVWFGIDCALDTIIGGINTGTSINQGAVGFIVTALFSGALGVMVAALGAALIFIMLYALGQALYIYITAIVAISLLVIVAPLFVPCILFNFIMQPVVLFAYLSMLLVALGHVVFTGETSIYKVVAGIDNGGNFGATVSSYYVSDNLGATTMNVNPAKSRVSGGGTVDQGPLGKQTAMSPCGTGGSMFTCLGITPKFDQELAADARAFFKIDQPIKVINWNAAAGSEMEILIAFLSAAMTAYIFLELLKHMPYIGAAVSNSSGGVPVFGTGNLSPTDNVVVKNLQQAFGGGGK